jgi:hypothetical protein
MWRWCLGAQWAQEEVRRFLERQIREAQQIGQETGSEWKEHLVTLLDYRRWFDIVTRVPGRWPRSTPPLEAADTGGTRAGLRRRRGRYVAASTAAPAVKAGGLDFNVRIHDLRHAHAS